GFKSESSSAIEKPNEERVADLVMLMPAILPALDEATVHFAATNTAISNIDAGRYPKGIPFTDFNVRQTIEDVQAQIQGLDEGIHQARPVLEILPGVLGAEG